jgi:hypothetical protein
MIPVAHDDPCRTSIPFYHAYLGTLRPKCGMELLKSIGSIDCIEWKDLAQIGRLNSRKSVRLNHDSTKS